MPGPTIHFPSPQEEAAVLDEFFAGMRAIRSERREAVTAAKPALDRIIAVMPQRTGQSYHLRALLYSLWNGRPTSLSDVLNLDWSLRQDFCAILLAFGFEDTTADGKPGEEFFYDAITNALRAAGQFEWFREAHKSEEAA
jgi:hypothetical protein